MKRLLYLLLLGVLMPLLFIGCNRGSDASNNLEEIYKEEGVPVKTVKMEPKVFETWFSFNAVLTGIEESSAHSMVSDKVDALYVQVGDYVEKDQIVMRVHDSGIGISPADQPYVFDKFFRADHPKTQDIRGTGLGLALAKSIVENHDGQICVESELSIGSTFTFTLPC